MFNFAIIGAAGYIAPRHLKAIKDTGNRLVAATDPHDAVGLLDRFAFDISYFREIERFDRHLEKLRRGPREDRIDYVSVCSPNYLHDAHMRLALRAGADAICEKPLVIKPWNLDALCELERETGKRVWTVLQLRTHPALVAFRESLRAGGACSKKHEVELTYLTARGLWYLYSWKGVAEKSGGLAMNIGIHFFDLLIWLFGGVCRTELHVQERTRTAGFIELERANIRWYLSIDKADLPFEPRPGEKTTFRSIRVDGRELEFSEGFADLHTRVYEETMKGAGFGIEDARPSIELVHRLVSGGVTARPDAVHPLVLKAGS